MTVDKSELGKAAKLMLERETLIAMSYKLGNQRFTIHTAPVPNGLADQAKTVSLPPHIARKFVVILLEENQEALRAIGVPV